MTDKYKFVSTPHPDTSNGYYYTTNNDNVLYFCFGKTKIKVKEFFSDDAKTFDELVEDVIIYHANNTSSTNQTL